MLRCYRSLALQYHDEGLEVQRDLCRFKGNLVITLVRKGELPRMKIISVLHITKGLHFVVSFDVSGNNVNDRVLIQGALD